MHAQNAEGWRGLCEQAAIEQDPLKLMQLVSEINRMLLEKEERLQRREQAKKQDAA